MIRFFHSGYSTNELKVLAQGLVQIQALIPCGELDCEECGYKNVCRDLTQFHKRVEHLKLCQVHNDTY